MDAGKIRTMEDLASAIGVSRPTISKYFNDPESVRKSIRERIEEALERYDYRPNFFAVNQNRRLTKHVGIVVPYLADPFFAEIARRVERRCLDAGFWPLLFSSHGERELESDILESLRSMKPAGVLLAPIGRASDRDFIARICEDVPVVLFDSNIEGLGEAFIGSDNDQSVPLIVEYLCRTGEPPCFFEMPPVNPNANKRRAAYAGAMERLGARAAGRAGRGQRLELRGSGLRGRPARDRGAALRYELHPVQQRPPRHRLLAAAYEKGLRVGRGAGSALRIAGHDNHPFSRFTCPSLTTVAQDYDSISRRSVETLVELVKGDGRTEVRTEMLFSGTLVMRESA